MAMAQRIDAYGELVQQIRNDLRLQHPEWIEPNGQCPMVDSYEARLIELLEASTQGESRMVAVSDIPIIPNAKNSPAPTFL